ncbi:hypothetical protein BGW36DRAFT_401832 [Talaromyces proteolyticus]|uniref:Arrestin C-terminal-like domain-containing protein n=1 Tax=Talaromyces proteolyticus TaxID=1131652 RepID=A0AAD4PSQ6_9EURO|nr:uncharacterized protein BGW36DRAFT_401832 [Talaromyces proteolyticus]KAH8689473.1 hypothetical protein BGW36DRAFT_401832 [Talaromyces proteolyticus]
MGHAQSTASVTGKLCVSFSDITFIKSIKVRLRGLLRVSRDGFSIPEDREHITFESYQGLASSKTLRSFQMQAGNYEFVFNISLSSKLTETLTGPKHQYHSYQIDAVIERRYRRAIVLSKPLRIYKISGLETNYLEPQTTLNIEGESNQNIQYQISIPNRNIAFGSTFPVQFLFTTPSKNIVLKSIKMEVVEKHNIRLDATAAQYALNIYSVRSERAYTVFVETFNFPKRSEFSIVDPTDTECCICKLVCLPQTFDSCSQSISTNAIEIRHLLIINAVFQDLNGQVLDQIANTIPFVIYMTPNVIGQDATVCGKLIQHNIDPPPPYGSHSIHPRLLGSTGMDSCGVSTSVDTNVDQIASEQNRFPQTLEPAPCYEALVQSEPPIC